VTTPANPKAQVARSTVNGGTQEPPPAGQRPRPQRRKIHKSSLILLVGGITLSLGLAIAAQATIANADSRYLRNELQQVAALVDASIPTVQQPLLAGAHLANTAGARQFRSYEAAEVGGLFRSVSLWRTQGGRLTLVASVGERPAITGNAQALRRLAAQPADGHLGVIGIVAGAARSLGLAERLPGGDSRYVVYAEDPLDPDVGQPPSPPFVGLSYELYAGASQSRSNLITSDVMLPTSAPTRSATVPFGDGVVTVVAVLKKSPPGALPTNVPWLIGIVGVALTAGAAVSTERLARRREDAELEAADSELRYVEQQDISTDLQESILPPADPSFPGLEVAGSYVAGVKALGVGGDWYDVIELDEHRCFLSVGDVAGRGRPAADVMSALRHAVRAYAVQGDPPGVVLAKLGEIVDVDRDDCFATVLCASVDVTARSIELASAGHLPPLLLDPDGARFVGLRVGLPVGLVHGAPPLPATRLVVRPGTTILLYTDGLVERRDRLIDVGLESLRTDVTSADGSVHDLVAGVVQRASDGTDDLAVLAVRWPPLAGPIPTSPPDGARSGTARRQTFAGDAASIESARRFAMQCLDAETTERRELVALMVSELATNAVVHARSAFDVTVDAGSTIRVTVHDHGQWRGGRDAQRDGGHGLGLVADLSDRWGIDGGGAGGTSVWFELAPATAIGASAAARERSDRR
jgi:serine phosphatase RsbU (regulator of sigma subunit)